MPNHPNRSRRKDAPARNPTPAEIRAARIDAGLTQAAAAVLIHCSPKSWEKWESGERRMHPAFWDLFGYKLAELAVQSK